MLAGKVKVGIDKLGITVNVELSLYLCFVERCVSKRNDMNTEGYLNRSVNNQ